MPRPCYIHPCCYGPGNFSSSALCRRCGEPGIFAHWDRSVPELMAYYTIHFRVKPIGRHRALADRLLGALRSTCNRCDGRGIVGNAMEYWPCPHCEGCGGVWTGSDAEIYAAYERIQKEFPDALAADSPLSLGWYPLPAFLAREQPVRPGRKRPARPAWVSATHPARPARRRKPRVRPAKLSDLQRAFIEAERRLGKEWKLMGHGHCRRATLKNRHARFVRRVISSWVRCTPHVASSPLYLYPFAIIEEAARVLGVDISDLVGKEY